MRFRREYEETGDVEEAVVRAFLAVGGALIVTTIVLLAGFSALFLSSLPTSHLFATICTICMLAALIGDLVFLPAMVVLFAKRRVSP